MLVFEHFQDLPGISVSPRSSSSSQLISLSLSTWVQLQVKLWNGVHTRQGFEFYTLASSALRLSACLFTSCWSIRWTWEKLFHENYQLNSIFPCLWWDPPWRSTSPKRACEAQWRGRGCCSVSSRGRCWSSARRSLPASSPARLWPGRRSNLLLGHPEQVDICLVCMFGWVEHIAYESKDNTWGSGSLV